MDNELFKELERNLQTAKTYALRYKNKTIRDSRTKNGTAEGR